MAMAAWPDNTNANYFFDKKKNSKLAKIQPSLHFYGIIILVKKRPYAEEWHGCHSKTKNVKKKKGKRKGK